MTDLKMGSRRKPFSRIVDGVLWQGQQIIVYAMDAEGNPVEGMEFHGGYREVKGRAVNATTSKYMPHQSTKECTRRLKQENSAQWNAVLSPGSYTGTFA